MEKCGKFATVFFGTHTFYLLNLLPNHHLEKKNGAITYTILEYTLHCVDFSIIV